MKIHVIIGSTRQNRFGDKPAKWIYQHAKKRKGWNVELVDLRDYPMPFFNEATSPAHMKGPYPNKDVQKWADKVAEADGYIIVTPEYNHGYPAVLKNAIDNVYKEWGKKPVGFVSYGSVGGARAVEQLRQVAVELSMASTRTAVHFPFDIVIKVMNQNEANGPNPFDVMNGPADLLLDQLDWWSKALKSARDQGKK